MRLRWLAITAIILFVVLYTVMTLYANEDNWLRLGRIGLCAGIAISIVTVLAYFLLGSSRKSSASDARRELPPVVSVDDADEFLQMIEGRWHLEYGKKAKSEDCIIDKGGNYYLQSDPQTVRQKLKDVRYDRNTRRVQFLKWRLPGVTPGKSHTEILTLNEDCTEMSGHAEHDPEHLLKYARVYDPSTRRYARPGPGETWPARG